MQKFFPASEAEIQGLLLSAEASRGCSLFSWLQHFLSVLLLYSFVLLKPTCFLKNVLNCEQNF
jgi:hypothetical protein